MNRPRIAPSLLPILLAAFLLPVALSAQNEPDGTLKLVTYLDWEWVANPQISPDGSQIIYTRSWVDKINDRRASEVYIMNADGSRKRRLTDGSSPKWSPSSDRILFTRQVDTEGTQIFVRWMDDEGAETQVSRLENSPGNIEWSPDGNADRLQHVRRFGPPVAHQPARAPRRGQVDRGAQGGRPARLPAGPARLYRRGVHAPVRRPGRRGHRPPAHRRRLEPQWCRVDTGRRRNPLHLATRRERRTRVAPVGHLLGQRGQRRDHAV